MKRFPFRWHLAILVAVAWFVGIPTAQAQLSIAAANVGLPPLPNGIQRSDNHFRSTAQKPYYFNRADCLNDVKWQFPIRLAGSYQNYQLEVWESTSTDCGDQATRAQAGQTSCILVASYGAGVFTKNNPTIEVPAQAAVGAITTPVSLAGSSAVTTVFQGSPASCNSNGVNQQSITLYFLLVDGGGALVSNDASIPNILGFDVSPPTPPSGLQGGQGETRIHLSWTDSVDTDIAGYDFFCDPPIGGGSSSSTATFRALAGGSFADAAADAAISGGTTGGSTSLDASTGTGASDGGANPNASCNKGSNLVPGGAPPTNSAQLCGSVTGPQANSGTASHLVNGIDYTVAISGFDTVGNVGQLSDNVCVTPVEVTDFFELYRQDGGGGGGGVCSVSRRPNRAPFGLFAILGAAAFARALGRRRRRS